MWAWGIGGRLPSEPVALFVGCALVASLSLLALGMRPAEAQTQSRFAQRFVKPSPGASGSFTFTEEPGARRVVVTVNKSRTLRLDETFGTATVGSNEIIDALPISDRTLYIQAKKIGTTNVTIFSPNARLMGIIDVEVVPDTRDLVEKIRRSVGGRKISVSASGSQIILSGVAADAVAADRAVSIAKGMAGDGGVVNAMEVAPAQQVMLEVRFLEVSRDAGRELGVNWFGSNNTGTYGARTGTGAVINPLNLDGTTTRVNTPSGIPVFQTAGSLLTGATPYGTILGRLFTANDARVDILVNALEEKGLIRRLAEPNLIALSGDTARFLAGGEFPVPVQSTTQGGIPTVTIEFKKFGVQLVFRPTVLSRGVINLLVEPEVSELDYTNAVQLQGTLIPSLTKRNARTTVELRDGQSFALAGLLASQSTHNLQQVPWIGSVPVLGALFRSAAYQQRETDLVIIVTPHLVAPAVPGQRLASPLDARLPSNDVDFFLNGQPDLKKQYTQFVTSGGTGTGPYGHILRPEVGRTVPVHKP